MIVASFLKDLAWLQLHNIVHGNESCNKTIQDTKELVIATNFRLINHKVTPLDLSKTMHTAIVFYNKHKSILDD